MNYQSTYTLIEDRILSHFQIISLILLLFFLPCPAPAQNSFRSVSNDTDIRVINGVSVPSDFPELNVNIIEEGIGEGKLFLANKNQSTYIMILENDGTPYFYRKIPPSPFDFNLQPDGSLTITSTKLIRSYDSNFTLANEFAPPDSFFTDPHEFLILENGNYFILASANRTFDMSLIVEGGKEDAALRDNILLEYTSGGDLVMEWNTKDYFNPAGAVDELLTRAYIDYAHVNSIAEDYDSNLVISSRNLSEVTKIDRETGEIIWRLGGLNNQFELSDDAGFFSHQHDVHPVKGKKDHYTIFDNGNFRADRYSRAVEYKLDLDLMTAVKVWEYRASPDIFSPFMGSAQRLPNGNTLINWGDQRYSQALEVDSSGNVLYDAMFTGSNPVYRTHRYDWKGVALNPYLIVEPASNKINLIFNKFGDRNIDYYNLYLGSDQNSLNIFDTTSLPYAEIAGLESQKVYYFAVSAVNSSGFESEISNIETVETNFTVPGENLLQNGDFSLGTAPWELNLQDSSDASIYVSGDNELVIDIINGSENFSGIGISQSNIPVINGSSYSFSFDAYSEEVRIIDAKIISDDIFKINFGKIGLTALETAKKNYSYNFVMENPSDFNSKIVFLCGNSDANVYIDNIVFKENLPDAVESELNFELIFTLDQNYPNPFNPTTTIEYSIPAGSKQYTADSGKKTDNRIQNSKIREQNQTFSYQNQESSIQYPASSIEHPVSIIRSNQSFNQPIIQSRSGEMLQVRLVIYDILGREVATLVNMKQGPGNYQVQFDGTGLSSGIYFYAIRAGSFYESKKMMLIK